MKSGIYFIKSTANGRIYVGSSSNLRRRWADHKNKLLKNQHHNAKLQNHYNKYGKDSFLFVQIEECLPDQLIQREQFWINLLNPKFNICTIANRTTGIKFKMPESAKAKISLAFKGRKRKHLVTIYSGKDHPQSKAVKRISLKDGSVKIYDSLSSVTEDGFYFQNVYNAMKKDRQHKGFKWSYSTERV